MKIYCKTCNKYILDTSPEFIIGGPYDGSMFQKVTNRRYQLSLNFPKLVKNTRKGSLTCPMCDATLEGRDGVLLTEHGRVRPGQATIDTRISFIHPNLTLKTKREWSVEIVGDRVGEAAKRRQAEIDEFENVGDDVQHLVDSMNELAESMTNKSIQPELWKKYKEDEPDLSERNKKIIEMHAKGISYSKIAKRFKLSMGTVGNIVRDSKKKP